MATWYVRSTGSDLNSGGTDADAAAQSGAAGVVVTTTLTEVGAFAAAAATGSINLQDAGNSLIRTYTKVDDDSITLDSAPTSGDGTYAWKIGGARATIAKVVTTGAGNNAKVASGDYVAIKGGTYTENNVSPLAGIHMLSSDGVKVVVDGTGGGAGSDCIVAAQAVGFANIRAANAVDAGFVSGNAINTRFTICDALSCGGSGFSMGGNATRTLELCSARACSVGYAESNGLGIIHASHSEFGDNTSHGYSVASGSAAGKAFRDCLFFDNGGDALSMPATGIVVLVGNTIEGSTSDGVDAGATVGFGPLSTVVNNIFSNNGAYGITCNSDPGFGVRADYNLYFGNTTAARNNFPTGTNDKTTDPVYTNAAGDDYSIGSTGGAFKAGYSPFKNPTLNALNIGAIPGPGSAEETGDYPAEADVRAGVSYANGTMTGEMVASSGFLGWPLG